MATDQQTKITKGQHGGLRNPPGGRPKDSLGSIKPAIAKAKQRAVKTVAREFQERLEARLLKGVDNIGQLADGYTKDEAALVGILPSLQANTYLIDRLLGKPTERVEGRGEVTIRIVYEKRPRVVDGKVHEEET